MSMGTSASQAIWVTHNGSTTTATLGELYDAYWTGRLGEYRIYYADPVTLEVSTVGIDTVINNKTQMGVRLTAEEGESVIVCATGGVMDISVVDDPVVIVSTPDKANYYYGGDTNGKPGNKRIHVRDIVKKEYVGITCMSLPVPNMISDSFYIIVA